MTSKTEEKWKINRQKNEFARTIPGKTLPRSDLKVIYRTFLSCAKNVELCVYEDNTFSLSQPNAFDDAQVVIETVECLRPYFENTYSGFYRQYDKWVELDKEATRKARLEKILSAIANNIAEIPELKDEIIKLGKMLERGDDIRPYCGLE
ncbi:MAG: hypothetical protein NZ455_03555 [Bacteroidia bacterium]|nr:hypothetical protein [Bacteroidia bacterium]MDW8346380.1 hypothetical protein [Bacteroidia bacterium]